jgi:hypothetical protein
MNKNIYNEFVVKVFTAEIRRLSRNIVCHVAQLSEHGTSYRRDDAGL